MCCNEPSELLKLHRFGDPSICIASEGVFSGSITIDTRGMLSGPVDK